MQFLWEEKYLREVICIFFKNQIQVVFECYIYVCVCLCMHFNYIIAYPMFGHKRMNLILHEITVKKVFKIILSITVKKNKQR